ncbi:ArnT family glycosyltransferase [Runella zeae]|uniref:ArnT family glycosyltransferase n=1 Tax=Runella zeae TaxID=94255 RepID=UPI0023555A15|nr:hypothetical protein [Runella zeae]
MSSSRLSSWLPWGAMGLIILAFCTYFRRYPTGDDAWFAEESYWLWKEGKVRSEFFRGLLHWEEHYLVSHKLFIAFGALLGGVFPNSLYTSKLSGLLFFGVIVVLLLIETQSKTPQKNGFWGVLILIFGNTLMTQMSFENRPEMMITAFGLASFYSLRRMNKNVFMVPLAGLFAGLAVLTHLNGIIFLGAGFLTLFLTRHYQKSFVFGIVGALTASLYFYDILQEPDGPAKWWFQFRNDPATQNAFGWMAKLKVLASYPLIFVESPEQLCTTLLLIAVGWFRRKDIRHTDRILLLYSLSLVALFWLITKRASAIYQVMFVPFMILLIYEWLQSKPLPRIPLYLKVMTVLYLIVGVVGNGQVIGRNLSGYLPQQYAQLRPQLPQKGTGLVPITFYFNEYEHFDKLLCHTNFELQMRHQQQSKPWTSEKFGAWAQQHKASFIVLDYKTDRADYYPSQGATRFANYQLVFADKQFSVYVLNPQIATHLPKV